jgi:hypothetical protein
VTEETATPTPAPQAAPPSTPGLSQADVDKAVAAAQKKAAQDTKAQLDEFLKAEKDKQDRTKMDEVDRLKAEKAEADQKVAAAEARAAAVEHQQRVTLALSSAGVGPDKLPTALRAVDVEPGATNDEIAAAVKALLEVVPGYAAPNVPAPNVPPTNGTQIHTPPAVRAPAGQIDPARERARKRHGSPVSAAS